MWVGALNLSWVHCVNALLHILSPIEQQFFCMFLLYVLYVFGPPFPLNAQGIIVRVMMWRHAAHANLHWSVAKKLSRLMIPVELLNLKESTIFKWEINDFRALLSAEK